jgi:hypothetical protein
MKKYYSLVFLLTIVLITSCNKEEVKDTYYDFGIISITSDSTIINCDGGDRLLVSNPNFGSTIQDKNRVYARFSLVNNKTLPRGIDYIVELTYIEKILFKPVIVLTSANADSIGNDRLSIYNIWLAKNFLNLDFYYDGSGQVKHYINLTRAQGAIPTDTIDLEIRQNNNDDYAAKSYNGFVTFDLTSLQNNVADSVILHVKAKEYGSRTFEKYFTYKY